MATAYLSVGSNIGNKKKNIEDCYLALEKTSLVSIIKKSFFYKTEPVDYLDQDWFINSAVKIETELSPDSLLKTLKLIEKNAGRKEKTIRFGPRIIDLDIILYDSDVLNHDNLEIPHPRMHQRIFVLRPLCDIAKDIIHPLNGKTISEMLSQLSSEGQSVVRLD